ncbi:Glutathionyl-hydroquinone reductase YqjG [Pigmentiphaga humi]|uniref:Glutathionyl-hydroquinone reductase YqjG n=1 Tax=Pigmentiphaga humi TaxID=2478468 RepID=A0A3P4AX69_9BURK|nr:glutathione S-transferase family protein [Pigmentiphaga humi]VCU68659.1 Glutathionyl-hydroquinone reductase YqjG [Pigmentiphaga humi]
MGILQNGRWVEQEVGAASAGGEFVREHSVFCNWVTADGRPGPTGEGGFRAEAGRYRLYVSLACPWAHRTLIFRRLKGLEAMIPISVVHWHLGPDGWSFEPGEGVIPDAANGKRLLRDIYTLADPHCSGKVTVPVLWDTQRRTIVSNESADIIRMFNTAFDALGAREGDYCPAALREEIDRFNERIYATVNNGVYRAGFAGTQDAYERAVRPLFETLDWLEERLRSSRYLCGDRITEADWRLFTTLLRFDAVYVGHFKCNLRRLADYPALWGYARELYQWPGVRDTVDFGHIKRHYYGSHRHLNPSGIVPLGPVLDFEAPHGRG